MNVEELDDFQGLDIITELIVSLSGFNPDDIFIARACPGCGRQPADASTMDLAGSDNFKVTVQGSFQDPVELWGTELTYCECPDCGSVYCVVMFGPRHYEGAVLTEFLIVREDRFLKRTVRELEALTREGRTPENVNEWITSKLSRSIDKALAMMDGQVRLTGQDWTGSRYRKLWTW